MSSEKRLSEPCGGDELFHVDEHYDEDIGRTMYRGHCPKCHWYGPKLSDYRLSEMVLGRHTMSRTHRTNYKNKHRFTA